MREIEFRAWDAENKELVYRVERGAYLENSFREILQKGYPLMQFTGLHDKHGKKIFESDIIKSEWQHDGSINRDYTWIGLVSWGGEHGEPAFYMYAKDGDSYQPFVSYDREDLISLEIIGNIYENPELLDQN